MYFVSLHNWFLLLYREDAFSRLSPASLLLWRKLSSLIIACLSSWVAWKRKKLYHKWRDTSSQSWLSSACSDVSPKTPVSALPTLPCTLPYNLFCLAGAAERGWTKPCRSNAWQALEASSPALGVKDIDSPLGVIPRWNWVLFFFLKAPSLHLQEWPCIIC